MTDLARSKSALTAIDRARIETRVEAVAVLVDLQAFGALKPRFADMLQLDYSSLFGGEVEQLSSADLMARWSGLVPGFDATRHALSDIEVELDGDTADASAAVTASHWLDGVIWRVSGRYVFRFAREEGDWRITEMAFLLQKEEGDRGLIERALARMAG